MRNRLSIFNFKSRDPLAAIILFVAMVIAIETALSLLPPNRLVRLFQVNRMVSGQAADVQIMGDSVAQGGIIAEDLERMLSDKKVVNRALAGTGPEFSYFILKHDLQLGKVPKTIVYAPSAHTFASLRISRLVGAFCDWPEIFEIVASGKEPFEVLYGIFCKLSYTLRYREQIAETIKGGGRSTTEIAAAAVPVKQSSLSQPETRFPKEHMHPMYRKKFEVQEFNRFFLEKFLELAARHDIKIFWATRPVLPVIYESRKLFNFDADFFQFLDDLSQRHNIHVLQKEFLLFDEAKFSDYTHLNKTGAEQFTRILGEKLFATGQFRNVSVTGGH